MEITRLVRTTVSDIKLNLDVCHTPTTKWDRCDSEKVANIKRKVKAIMGDVDGDRADDYNEVVDLYLQSYITGMEILRTLRASYTEIYEDIFTLEQKYRKQVSMQTKMNTDSTINRSLFNDILSDFENKLRSEFNYFTSASIIELKLGLVSGWLADCSMQFRR